VQAGRALPTSRERGARQSSLENNLNWGFELLEPSEQTLLMRLGLLDGTFQRDFLGAFAPADFEGLLEISLETLVDSGWVKGLEQGFRLLETVRVFALGKAREHALEAETMAALFDFLIPLALEAGDKLYGQDSAAGIAWLERMWPHLRQSLYWGNQSNQHERIEIVVRVTNMTNNWSLNGGRLTDVVALLSTSLVQPGVEAKYKVRGYGVLATALEILGHNKAAQQALECAVELVKLSPDLNSYLPRLECELGNIHFAQYQLVEAQQCFERSICLFQLDHNRRGELGVHHDLGCLLVEMGRFVQAREQLEFALSLLEDEDSLLFKGAILLPLGVAARYLGELDLALCLLNQMMSIGRELHLRVYMAHAHHNLGFSLMTLDPNQAGIHLREAVRLKRSHNQGFGLVESLGLLALFERTNGHFSESQAALLEATTLADGMDVTLRLILPLEGLAALELATGDIEQAAKLSGASQRLLEGITFR